MTADAEFEKINEAKAKLDHIYNQLDPRAYFRELETLDYSIPGEAQPVFQKLTAYLQRHRNGAVHVLDLGCSYGINAALLKHNLSLPQLYEHWAQQRLSEATAEEVIEYDQHYFGRHKENKEIEVVGLDLAENAVAFAEKTGLLDDGFALNLELEPLPAQAREALARVDLVTSTGSVGYLTEKSFAHLLPTVTQGRPAWLANFVLRMFPFDAIEETLNDQGYVTEKLEDRTFFQRRFASTEEQEQVLTRLSEQGIDPTGKETEGHLLAEFYLSRPAIEVQKTPIEQFVV
jgi:predicted TPR repeat methyltransferase